MTDKQLQRWCEHIVDAWQKRDHKREKRLNDTLIKILTKERIEKDIRKEKFDKYTGIGFLLLFPILGIIFTEYWLMAFMFIPFVALALKQGDKV